MPLHPSALSQPATWNCEAISPAEFCQSPRPFLFIGPHRGQRVRHLHAHVNPLPELPAVTHVHEVQAAPDHLVPPHMHLTHEITYVVSGRGHWQVEDQSLEVRAGDLWIARPGEVHSGGADADDPYRIYVLGIDATAFLGGDAGVRSRWAHRREFVARRQAQGALVLNPPALDPEFSSQPVAPYDFEALERRRWRGNPTIATIFGRLIHELDGATSQGLGSSSRGLSVLMIRALLVELFVEIARSREIGRADGSGVRFGALCQWLESRLHRPPSTAEMAAHAGLSAATFAEAFKRETGRTPHEYLLDCRLGEAARRLNAEPALGVTRIALDLGFSSPQYFASAFKKRFGTTPTQWRLRGG